MEFRLLGSVEVWLGERRVQLGTPQQLTVLVALAVDAGRPVSLELLIDRVWPVDPPGGARGSLYAHIARLRRVLRPTSDRDTPEPLPLRAGGYVLDVDPDCVDAHRFRRLVSAATERQLSDQDRVQLLDEALGLWRGRPLAGVPGDWAARIRNGWELQRLDAITVWAQAQLRLGRPGVVIGPMRDVIADHPFAEAPICILMRALAAAGRPTEALEYYATARTRLVEDLGLEPGPDLRAAHQAVLRGEVERPVPGPVPQQLPADVSAFTGRADELAALDRLVDRLRARSNATGGQPPTGSLVGVVSGTAGVGKTALAVRWAHRVRAEFPDGQLYVDLRGYDPEQPIAPADVLARFLHAMGVAGEDVPLDTDARATRYRTELSGRRLLVLLDNAVSVEQVRPLLPGSPTCAVVVTSRDSMAGLVARDGAARVDVDLLPIEDAVTLLRQLVGRRAMADRDSAVGLARHCARLPLALRVAAELATIRPAADLAELVEELADEQRRLELLDAGGDARAGVSAVFSWSYRQLPVEAARLYRYLGLHPGSDLDVYAAAALGEVGVDTARRLLDRLVRAHLVHLTGSKRYGMHDLLRAYAARLAATDPAQGRREALTRLFDHYLSTAAAAMDTLHPAERARRPSVARSALPVQPVADADAARAWFAAERVNLVATCVHAAKHERPGYATRLAMVLYRHLDVGGHHIDALTIHRHALEDARRAADPTGEAHALNALGGVYWALGHHDDAVGYYLQALALCSDTGDQAGQARALSNLGGIRAGQGQHDQAGGYLERAVALFREIGDRCGEAIALTSLGVMDERQGRYESAIDRHRQALVLFREAGSRDGAMALTNLGSVYVRQERYPLAVDHLERALTLQRETDDRQGEAYALDQLGVLERRRGRHDESVGLHEQALALFRDIGDRVGEAEALNGLGEVLDDLGSPQRAGAAHASALELVAATGDRYVEARAHRGLGNTQHTAGDSRRAEYHWQRALALYTELSAPEAEQVRARLGASAGHRFAGTPASPEPGR